MVWSFFELQGSAAASMTASGSLCAYHGTTITSAQSIVANGVNWIAIQEISGYDVFWMTILKGNAAFYAEARTSIPSEMAIIKAEIQPNIIVDLINAQQAAWSVDDKGMKFLKEGHQVLNQAMTNVTILTHLDF